MATYRIGIGSFSLAENGGVGIGTDSAGLGNLKVEGTVKTTDLEVNGVSTFTRYAGFAADDLNIVRDTSLTGEHSTTGDIVVGLNNTFTVSTGSTVTVGTVENVSIGTHFSPPTGGVEERPEVPVEGTVRFNKDLNTLEFYNGFEWRQFVVNGASGRGIIAGGRDPSNNRQTFVGYVNIMSKGNENNFGDLTDDRAYPNSCSDGNRCLVAGGLDGTPFSDIIDYSTIQSGGFFTDFGNLTTDQGFGGGGCSNSTRGLFSSWYPHSAIIDYVEIQTLGNALDFGDRSITVAGAPAALASPTRALWAGGYTSGSPLNSVAQSYMDFVTISSKGNAAKFGDLTKKRGALGGCSNTVRGVWGGGTDWEGSTYELTVIDYVTIASEGNATHFGDLTFGRGFGGATSTQTRGIFGGMRFAPAVNNVIDYISIQTGGAAIDFGDLALARKEVTMTSDSHGGLGGY